MCCTYLIHHTLLILILEQRHGRQVQRQHQVIRATRRCFHLRHTPLASSHSVLPVLLHRHPRLHLRMRTLLPSGFTHLLRVLLGGDLDLALEARLQHRHLYALPPTTASTVLLVLQPAVQRVHQPAQELRGVASCLDSETLLAGTSDFVDELEMRGGVGNDFVGGDVCAEAGVRPELAHEHSEGMHEGALGIGVV